MLYLTLDWILNCKKSYKKKILVRAIVYGVNSNISGSGTKVDDCIVIV